MNRRAFNIVAVLTITVALGNFLLPQLTGKTMLTKMQISVIVIGGIVTVATNWISILLHPPKLPVDPTPVTVSNTQTNPVPVVEPAE